ncbi:MAG: molybdopterin oxidoreductase, partial [Bacteroidetes bacterium]
VPDATPEELSIFRKARKHLSKTTFDEVRWSKAVVDQKGNNWFKKVVHVLNKGGRFEDFDKYRNSGDKMPHLVKRQFNIYSEHVALGRHPFTGKRFSGLGIYEPVRGFDGKEIKRSDFGLQLITYKDILGGHSRTVGPDYWLTSITPENKIIINAQTAKELGVEDGDEVKLVSATNKEGIWDLKNGTKIPVKGKVEVRQGMRPGVVAVSWSYGHWAYGAQDVVIDGEVVKGEERRSRGLCPNSVMETDPVLKNVTLEDVIGGSASFYDSKVNLVKV